MKKEKTLWKSIGIPKTLFEKIRKLIAFEGTPNVSEYCRRAIHVAYQRDKNELEAQEVIE